MKTNRLVIVIAAGLALSIAPAAGATTYYVDQSIGSDSFSGTAQTISAPNNGPFLTITQCVNSATHAGDACFAKNGTYSESLNILASGVLGSPITFMNFPGHSPKIDCGTMPVNCVGINPDGTAARTISYVVFQGFEITGGIYTGLKFMAADHLVIRGNYIHDTGSTDGNGILGSCLSCTIDGNRIADNGFTSGPHGHGMYLTGHGWTVTNNIVYGNQGFGLQAAAYDYNYNPSAFPTVDYAGWSGLIANNTFAYSHYGSGIVLWDAGNGNGGNNPSAMQPIIVENNILHENCTESPCTQSGITFYCQSIGAQVRNNVYFSTRFGAAGLEYDYKAPNTYNSDILTVNSLSTNPNMVNAPATPPASPDYHLTSGSIAVGFGLNLYSQGVTTDFSGLTPRPQSGNFDAGAYQLTSTSGGSVSAVPAKPTGLIWR